MLRKKIKGRVRRAQITGAALDAVAQGGLKGLTISAIAKEIGMSGSNLYRHFSKKEAVLENVIAEIDMRLRQIRNEAGENEKDSAKRLKYIFQKHIEFLESNKGIPKIIFSDDMYSSNGVLTRRLLKLVDEHSKEIKEILSEGIRLGVFNANLDIDAAAMAFLGLIQSTVMQWMLLKQSIYPSVRGEKLWNIYLRGIS